MRFIKPPHERTTIPKYAEHCNSIINLDKVIFFKKARERYYPDNEGIPTIEFWFGGEDYHQWYFDKGEEKKRDLVYTELLLKE